MHCVFTKKCFYLFQNCPCLHQRGATNKKFGIITTTLLSPTLSSFWIFRQILTKSNIRQITIGRPNCRFNANLATRNNLKLYATQHWKKRPKSAVGEQQQQQKVVGTQLSEAQVRNNHIMTCSKKNREMKIFNLTEFLFARDVFEIFWYTAAL